MLGAEASPITCTESLKYPAVSLTVGMPILSIGRGRNAVTVIVAFPIPAPDCATTRPSTAAVGGQTNVSPTIGEAFSEQAKPVIANSARITCRTIHSPLSVLAVLPPERAQAGETVHSSSSARVEVGRRNGDHRPEIRVRRVDLNRHGLLPSPPYVESVHHWRRHIQACRAESQQDRIDLCSRTGP